jgi:hypothetical protein
LEQMALKVFFGGWAGEYVGQIKILVLVRFQSNHDRFQYHFR